MTRIPKCMSTQHPDNMNSPFFAEDTELGGEDEVQPPVPGREPKRAGSISAGSRQEMGRTTGKMQNGIG